MRGSPSHVCIWHCTDFSKDEMNVDDFRRAGHAAVEEIAAYYEKLQLGSEGFQVAPSMKPGDLFKQIPESPPNEPTPFDEVQKDFDKLILPATCHWQHPSFYAYFPANSTFESIIADMYTTATSTPGFNHSCNPAATELEQAMTSWVGQMLGLDPSLSKNGVIQTTASDGAIIACVAARERVIKYLLAKKDSPYKTREKIQSKLIMYGSTQTHSLGAKAGLVLGIPFRAIETYAEDNWALTGESFKKAIKEDQAKGLIPFMLISTIGSTSSGTVDKLAELCEVAKQYPEIYIHVDAAWAGVYLALPEEREKLGLDAVNKRGEQEGELTWGEVHSFCTNLHKNGLVAFDCSTFFIRDSKLLTEVLDLTPPFLRNQAGYGQVTDYRNWGLSLGRRFRSLKILFVLRSYGVQGFQSHLLRTIELGRVFEEQVKKDEDFEVVTPRSLALVVFRLKLKARSQEEEALNDLNKRFYARLHKHTSIQLTSTIIGSTFCIRFVPGSPWTREEHVLAAWRIIRETAQEELAA